MNPNLMNSPAENLESTTKKIKPKNKIYLQVRDSTKCCNEALISNPKNIGTLYVMGKCLIQQENFGLVRDVIDKMKCLDPNNLYCHILEGHIFLKDGNIMESYDSFLRAYMNIADHDVFLSYGLGLFYDVLENYKMSREWFTLILTSDVELFKYLEIMYRIGVCYKKEQRLQDALGVFNRLETFVKTELFRDDVRLQIAHVYEIMNETEHCINILNKLRLSKQIIILVNRLYTWIHFKNKNFDLIKNQFKCQKEGEIHKEFSMKNLHKELNYCECAVMNETKDQYILYILGRVLALENRNEEALELFIMCTRLDSMSYLAYNSAGVINFKLKRYEIALKFFQQALCIKSYFSDARNNLKVVNCKLRSLPNNMLISESDPDLFKTKYLDSQTIFNEFVFFVNVKDVSLIKELEIEKFTTNLL